MKRHVYRPLAAMALAVGLAAAGPAAAQPATMYPYVTQAGDTLIGLGRRFLIDPHRWPAIARANRLRNPDLIPTGSVLLLPLALMRTEPVPATVLGVVGEVRADGQVLVPGAVAPPLREGSAVQTGADGHLSVRLVDGTVLRLRPGSRLELSTSRRLLQTPAVQAGARLNDGRVEVEAAPAGDGRPGFRIGTPQGVLAVRGTEFRVAAGAAASRGEVLDGVVAVRGGDGPAAARGEQRVAAGFGTVVDTAGQVAPPVPLLPAPDLAALPTLHERILVRFELPPLAAPARGWRVQVARRGNFDDVLADLATTERELRLPGLPDDDYVLRLRAVDAQGLEGQDADHQFRLKARPEPPLQTDPAPDAVVFGGRVTLHWTLNDDAGSYRLQVARDADFATVLEDRPGIAGASTELQGLPPGRYHWRLRGVRPDGDAGPWGAGRAFDVRPPPPAPPAPSVGDHTVRFSWTREPGQRFDFQLATDAAFERRVVERAVDGTEVEIPRPGIGSFFVRLRAIEPDGFVGPWGTTQRFEVPACLRDSGGACVRSSGGPLTLRR